MKTPDRPTRVQLNKAAPPAAPMVAPWGAGSARVLVASDDEGAPAGARGGPPASGLRERLRSEGKQAHPEGKAAARRRYFGQQRGLPDTEPVGRALASRGLPAPARRLHGQAARASATLEAAPSFAATVRAALPVWRDLGPTLIPHGQTYGSGPGATPSVSGRTCGLVVDRGNPRHLVLASSGGGLWGSLDAGATWAPLTDQQPTLVMGAVAQAPSAPAVMYAATGDGDGQIPYGVGVLRSVDGGASWSCVTSNALTGTAAYDLAVHPADALQLLVATDRGLFASRNGGQTVQSALPGLCWSVSFHPDGAGEVLATRDDGLVRSTDGGRHWTAVALPGAPVGTSFDRLEVAHAGGNGAVAWLAGCVDGQARLWRRASAGGAFQAQPVPSRMDTSQAWYDWCLAVSPHDPDLLVWGAIELYRGQRSASGIVWTKISSRSSGDSIHPDQHAALFDPASPGTLYACNDGGLYRSPDLGSRWQSLNPGLGITEFEYLAQLDSQPGWLFGGTQDNGSLTLAGPRLWDQVALGDGGDCVALDRGAQSVVFHGYFDMPLERALALGPQAFAWQDVSPPTPKAYQALFYPPLEARPGLLARAGASLWVSTDDGGQWSEVLLPTSGDDDPDLASALCLVDANTVLVGMQSGQLWRARRGASGWGTATVVALGALPGYVSDIACVGATGKTVWATCSRLGVGHVFRSLNSGKSFADRSANLPDLAVNALVVDPKSASRLWLGTDRGVWRSSNGGASWSAFSNGLPNVIVGDLVLHAPTRRLRAGTRARGAWEIDV